MEKIGSGTVLVALDDIQEFYFPDGRDCIRKDDVIEVIGFLSEAYKTIAFPEDCLQIKIFRNSEEIEPPIGEKAFLIRNRSIKTYKEKLRIVHSAISEEEPKNNDGRETCFWCGEKTREIPLFTGLSNICPKCEK